MEYDNSISSDDVVVDSSGLVPDDNIDSNNVSVGESNEEFSGDSIEESSDMVSGNDFSESVSDNDESIGYYDDSALVGTISLLRDDIVSLNNSAIEISTLLLTLVFFTVFKWCENKIKNFRKGFYKK